MNLRKNLALATAAAALGSGLALAPATGAFADTAAPAAAERTVSAAAYSCTLDYRNGKWYAGHYNGSAVTKSGSPKKRVAEVQCLLRSVSISPGTIDGLYGSKTRKAVVKFQKKYFPNKPGEWDGIVGAKTWKKLRTV